MTMTKKKHKTPERLLIEPEEKELAKTNNIVHQSIGTLLINLRKKANLSTTQASEMMEISRSLLSKLEHGKNMSTEKLADIIAYYIAFIEENSEVKISCREILNEIIMQASPFS
ncbi:helix-turn-helix transcriptional regulator [Bacteroides fragilis]|nr:helix-turn-helix transcriptional regulator [Bacteroides fragilis]MCM0295881.1 helix-turn-helix transcriptional regulator [Bacteroides fragilis]MCM0301849.1 helix-turn-helix transcriptional regulator [Bacteroides fragilis]MCM0340292.1 helix-turn-helix transcriptional regulator [Bacteroides fragilis]